MNAKAKAVALGFKLMHDYKTNLVHLSNDGTTATCNSRFIGSETEAHYADDLACTRCLTKLAKAEIEIGKAIDFGFDDSDGKWIAYCNMHDTLIAGNTKAELTGMSTTEFCDCCRETCKTFSYTCPNCKQGGAIN